MKKLFTLVAVAGMFAFYACGPSAEEKAAVDKAREDSVKAAEAAAATQDAEMQTAQQDSAAMTTQADTAAGTETHSEEHK